MGWAYCDSTTLPHLYDILWCRFPELGLVPGPTIRPVLVRRVMMDRLSRRGAVAVSYGTTKLKLLTRMRSDLIIQNAVELARLGLPHATRFDLDLTNLLPWCEEFFCVPSGRTSIKVGSLSDEITERLVRKLRRRGIIKE